MNTKLLFSELPIGCEFTWGNYGQHVTIHRYLKVARYAYIKPLYSAGDTKICRLPHDREVWSADDPLRLAVLLARERAERGIFLGDIPNVASPAQKS